MQAALTLLPIPAEERFSLVDTLFCGQCFRWSEAEDGWCLGIADGHACRAKQASDGLLLDCAPEDAPYWAEYFDLSTSYADLREHFCANPALAKAMRYAPGIRVLRQPAWEALCTFIVSQNNNIPRIRGIVERLCASFGERLSADCYAFPGPERLAALTEADLAPLRAGFRAAYLLDAAQRVASGTLAHEPLYRMPLPEAREALQTIRGVGPKVAECALLYGFGRMECFPMDVWMKRVMAALFPDGLPECARSHAGIAQQYLFHYARTCPEFSQK